MIDPAYMAFILFGVFGALCIRAVNRSLSRDVKQSPYRALQIFFFAIAAIGEFYLGVIMGDYKELYPTQGTPALAVSSVVAFIAFGSAIFCYCSKSWSLGTLAITGVFAAFYVYAIATARTYLAPAKPDRACEWVSDQECAAWNQARALDNIDLGTFFCSATYVMVVVTVVVSLWRANRTAKPAVGSVQQ